MLSPSSRNTSTASIYLDILRSFYYFMSSPTKGLFSNNTEERRGLLDEDVEYYHKLNSTPQPWPAKNILITALAFIALLVFGIFARTMHCTMPGLWGHPQSSTELLSNGTHIYKKTVVIISIDGLR